MNEKEKKSGCTMTVKVCEKLSYVNIKLAPWVKLKVGGLRGY